MIVIALLESVVLPAVVHAVVPPRCISFLASSFDQRDVEQRAIHMPLDTIHLQVLAHAVRVLITVLRLMADASQFQPPDATTALGCAHLLMPEGIWRPLLGFHGPEDELQPRGSSCGDLGITARPIQVS